MPENACFSLARLILFNVQITFTLRRTQSKEKALRWKKQKTKRTEAIKMVQSSWVLATGANPEQDEVGCVENRDRTTVFVL